MTFINLLPHINFIYEGHQQHAEEKNTYRLWDKRTPYAIHPIWCATTILTETSLPEPIRQRGVLALLYHDILEDTDAKPPKDLAPNVIEAIHDMTFDSFQQETKELATKNIEIQLFKLYDKTSNLLDATWMNEALYNQYHQFTAKLCKRVESKYGQLNICRIFQQIPQKPSHLHPPT
jgi:hypothetical protein